MKSKALYAFAIFFTLAIALTGGMIAYVFSNNEDVQHFSVKYDGRDHSSAWFSVTESHDTKTNAPVKWDSISIYINGKKTSNWTRTINGDEAIVGKRIYIENLEPLTEYEVKFVQDGHVRGFFVLYTSAILIGDNRPA